MSLGWEVVKLLFLGYLQFDLHVLLKLIANLQLITFYFLVKANFYSLLLLGKYSFQATRSS